MLENSYCNYRTNVNKQKPKKYLKWSGLSRIFLFGCERVDVNIYVVISPALFYRPAIVCLQICKIDTFNRETTIYIMIQF